jgi:hypothetical protein
MFGVAKSMQACQLDKGVAWSVYFSWLSLSCYFNIAIFLILQILRYGCSAGALTACGIAVGGNFDDAIKFCKEYCIPAAYSTVSGLFQLAEYCTKCIEFAVIPVYKELQPGTLNVAVTRLPYLKGEIISSFETKDDLKAALLASSAVFPFAPLVHHNGKWYIDGGLSSFQPVANDETITVSPFYFSDCDIKPSRYIPLWWALLPPASNATIDWLYNLGFVDGINFLKSRGIVIREELLNQEEKISHPYNIKKKVT